MRWLRRGIGLGLVVASATPIFLLLQHPATGIPGEQTVARAWTQLQSSWWGTATMLGAGLVIAILFPVERRLRPLLYRIGTALRRPPSWPFALALGAIAGLLAILASRVVFQGLPTLEDSMASLVHARYLAAGHLAGALPDPAAAWLIPNTLQTDAGWVSQYPPLHPLLLAAGLKAGVPWLVGPLLLAVTVALSTRIGELLLEDRLATARTGAVLVAMSPFMIFLGAGYLSHMSAAALTAAVLYAAIRTHRDQSVLWPIVTGLAAGGLVASRPWIGLALGVVLPAGFWAVRLVESGRLRELFRRLALATVGGLPVAIALGLYNQHFFGHPFRFGYTAGYGDAHLPGFHRDPWGNLYGIQEAIGYTAADLLALGIHLLESPLPVVLLVGLALLLLRRMPRGNGLLLGWALLPVGANALYWHHGFHMGPRMLFEAAPAWCFLLAVGMVDLLGEPELDGRQARSESSRGAARMARRLRSAFLVALLLSVPVVAASALSRAESYRWSPETLARIQPPPLPSDEPALVFVHGSWPERVSARLMATGLSADSVETALRRNDLCAAHEYAKWRAADESGEPPLPMDFRNLPGRARSIDLVESAAGYRLRRDSRLQWTSDCIDELEADQAGVVSLAPLLWQGDLPGIEEGRPMFVRDLGAENRTLSERYRNRGRFFYASPDQSLVNKGRGE